MEAISNLTNTSHNQRVAAAQAEVGSLRGACQFFRGVPEGLCDRALVFNSFSLGGSAIVRDDLVVNRLRIHGYKRYYQGDLLLPNQITRDKGPTLQLVFINKDHSVTERYRQLFSSHAIHY